MYVSLFSVKLIMLICQMFRLDVHDRLTSTIYRLCPHKNGASPKTIFFLVRFEKKNPHTYVSVSRNIHKRTDPLKTTENAVV